MRERSFNEDTWERMFRNIGVKVWYLIVINKNRNNVEQHVNDIKCFRDLKQKLKCFHLIEQLVGLWGSHLGVIRWNSKNRCLKVASEKADVVMTDYKSWFG